MSKWIRIPAFFALAFVGAAVWAFVAGALGAPSIVVSLGGCENHCRWPDESPVSVFLTLLSVCGGFLSSQTRICWPKYCGGQMSALGQKQTFHVAVRESALPPKADIVLQCGNVRLVPRADMYG